MKLILREHVDKLGNRGDVVNVARGYARNFLLPKGLAWEATPGYRLQLEQQKRAWVARDARATQDATALATRIQAIEIEITRKAGETGTLYGAVTSTDIAELLAAKGVVIDRRKLVVGDPIKAVGEYEIGVRLHAAVQAKVRLRVLGESTAD
jgi:large subunit ribosomal protein L9